MKSNEASFFSIEINKPLPAPVHSACRSDSSSEANSSCCHKSDAWSYLGERVVSSTVIAILQITSSGRSLMYSGKSIGPRTEP